MLLGLDHVQIAMPLGEETEARAFYADLLGLSEIAKPPILGARGGVWFSLPDGRGLHLGVEEPFVPAKKAHLAFGTANLDILAGHLSSAGVPVFVDVCRDA